MYPVLLKTFHYFKIVTSRLAQFRWKMTAPFLKCKFRCKIAAQYPRMIVLQLLRDVMKTRKVQVLCGRGAYPWGGSFVRADETNLLTEFITRCTNIVRVCCVANYVCNLVFVTRNVQLHLPVFLKRSNFQTRATAPWKQWKQISLWQLCCVIDI